MLSEVFFKFGDHGFLPIAYQKAQLFPSLFYTLCHHRIIPVSINFSPKWELNLSQQKQGFPL
ncbi:hypothetical protein BpHYR1_027240 [Brachionus plicatilis]|uniref:Uncharacterized protein n=1 Tax=Brachionus plicatilis TaxID=10195 RepID=A0A3M7SND3_BRAPC|nr:hypothetical protein BpHYR1_027240 [Brachionus plicatilis]